jgi:hypothetical protein
MQCKALIDKKGKIALVTTVDYVSVVNWGPTAIKALLDNDRSMKNLIIKIEDDIPEIIIGLLQDKAIDAVLR